MIDNETPVAEPMNNSFKDRAMTGEQQPSSAAYSQDDRAALARMLNLAMADASARGETLNLDTSEEIPRIIPLLCAYFSQEELAELVGKKVAGKILKMYRTEMLQNLFLEGELQRVLHAFSTAGIPLMLFKGPALAYTIYPRPHLRTYHDIDALISESDIPRARDLLVQMGYEFYEEYRSNTIDKTRSGYNFTLKRPDSWLEVLIELHTAPHASEIGSNFDVALLWSRAQSITVLGEQTLTLHPIDHLLYLCWHYRFHGFTRLLWLYDIVALLRAFRDTLDWDELVRTAQHQNMAATLYYCCTWCCDLFGVPVPSHVLTKLRPPLLCRLLVERITISNPAQVLASASGRSRRVVAHHAMVDSTTRLLQAGLTAFFPPPAVLARRYMDTSRLPLQLFFLYYLIHPWSTLAKGISYLLHAKRKREKIPEREGRA